MLLKFYRKCFAFCTALSSCLQGPLSLPSHGPTCCDCESTACHEEVSICCMKVFGWTLSLTHYAGRCITLWLPWRVVLWPGFLSAASLSSLLPCLRWPHVACVNPVQGWVGVIHDLLGEGLVKGGGLSGSLTLANALLHGWCVEKRSKRALVKHAEFHTGTVLYGPSVPALREWPCLMSAEKQPHLCWSHLLYVHRSC